VHDAKYYNVSICPKGGSEGNEAKLKIINVKRKKALGAGDGL